MTAPVTFSNKTQSWSTAGTPTQVTASVAFLNNRLYLVSIHQGHASTPAAVSGITGGGITWVQIADTGTTAHRRGSVWRGLVTSGATTGALTISLPDSDSNVYWSVDESDGNVDTTGTNGSGAIVQSAITLASTGTTCTVTLAPFTDVTNNSAFVLIWHALNVVTTHKSGFTELSDQASGGTTAGGMDTQYRTGQDLTPNGTWVGSTFNGGVAMEIKALVTGADPKVIHRPGYATSKARHRASRW
jgi:hypothetical protein